MFELLLSGVILAVLAFAVLVLFVRRGRAERKGAERLRLSVAEGQTVPLSLHPVIDPTLCVGSFSCIKSCPEGEIIGVVDGVATLVEAAHCIGHARCAVECPVGAIKLVFGTAERGVDLPESDESFESSRAGVFIVGELSGMGLIKNALHQGLVLGNAIKAKLKKSEANATTTDVVIVGGGPAGIASAISCRQQGLTVRVLEQDTLGGTIAHYPRGKVVMTEQIDMPKFGPFGRSLLSKEELLDDMKKLVRANKLEIEEGQKVISVDGEAPFLSVTTGKGDRIQCRAVVLAIGLRGSPRKLGVPGEEQMNVTYRLVDPEQYHGRSVLVVGGGDSAVEAAIQLAEESTAKVSISYRQGSFSRAKPRNRDKITQLINEGRIRALFGTRVLGIEPGMVRLGTAADEDKERDGKKDAAKDPKRPEPPDPFKASPSTVIVDPGLILEERDVKRPGQRRNTDELIQVAPTVAVDETRFDAPPPTKSEKKGFPSRAAGVTASFRARIIEEFSGSRKRPKLDADGNVIANDKTADAKRSSEGSKEGSSRDERPAEQSRSVSRSSRGGLGGIVKVIAKGRARTLEELEASTTNQRVSDSQASMRVERKEIRLKNDDVIVSVGGELPTEFLNAIRVGTRRYHGDEKAAGGAGPNKGLTKAEVESRSRRRLALTLLLLGASIIASLMLIGQEYYWLPLDDRVKSPLHALLRPSGLWGHGVGVAATTFMLANFVYALRKRWRPLKGKASIRTWLTFHMFVGIMSPLVIAFHAAFLVNNLLAVWTWMALAVVVGTGIFGRFLFGFVPAQAGKMIAVAELRAQVQDMEKAMQPRMRETKDVQQVTRIFDMATTHATERTLIAAVMRESSGRHKIAQDIESARPYFKDDKAFSFFRDSLVKITRARLQISFYATLKRIFRSWLVFHVVVAIFMVVLIGAHVAVTTYLGFGAFFTGAP